MARSSGAARKAPPNQPPLPSNAARKAPPNQPPLPSNADANATRDAQPPQPRNANRDADANATLHKAPPNDGKATPLPNESSPTEEQPNVLNFWRNNRKSMKKTTTRVTALGSSLTSVNIIRIKERLPRVAINGEQRNEWNDYGKKYIRPLLTHYDVRSYAEVSDKMARYCKDIDGRLYKGQFVTSENDLRSFCQGTPFMKAILRLYFESLQQKRKPFMVPRNKTYSPFLKQTKFQMNQWFSDMILSDLKQRCPTTEQVIPTMQEYMAIMYEGIELPTDSLSKFLLNLDKHLLVAFCFHHRELVGLSEEGVKENDAIRSDKTIRGDKEYSDKAIKIAFLVAYEGLIGKNVFTQRIMEQSEETRRHLNEVTKARYKETRRKEKAKKAEAMAEANASEG